jgi:hypothetical protein
MGMGIGDWGLGIGQSPIPNPQSPIPNPQKNYNFCFLSKFNQKLKICKNM